MAVTKALGTTGNGVGVVTPIDHKAAQSALFVKTSTANLIRPGVLYNGTASLVLGRATMSYDVLPFTAALTRGATAGTVILSNDGTVTVNTTAAPGSNSRIDVIYVWAREFSIDGVDSNPVIGVIQGIAAASPTVPSLAAFPGAIELARVTVPAGVTATNSGTTFTQTAPFTAVDGGTIPFRNTTEMSAWTTALVDQQARDLASGTRYRFDGSAWAVAEPGGKIIRQGVAGAFAAGWSILQNSLWTPEQPVAGVTVTNGVFGVSRAGMYDVEGSVMLDTSIAATLIVKRNSVSADSTGIVGGNTCGAGPSSFTLVNVKARIKLAAGDTIALAILLGGAAQWSNDKLAPSFFSVRYSEPAR